MWRVGITLIPLSCTFFSIVGNFLALPFSQQTSSGEIISTLFFNVICCLIPWTVLVTPLFWITAIRNYRQEQDIGIALRQSYNRIVNGQSFNIDDILMTLKSILPLILFAVRDVLGKNGLDVKVIDAFAENIMTINNIQNIFGNQNAIAGTHGAATTNIAARPN